MKRIAFALAACIFFFRPSSNSSAGTTMYSVFCANEKIEVDMRTLEQMKSARGSDVCMFGQFTSYSSALDLANKQFGGVGAKCTCGR